MNRSSLSIENLNKISTLFFLCTLGGSGNMMIARGFRGIVLLALEDNRLLAPEADTNGDLIVQLLTWGK